MKCTVTSLGYLTYLNLWFNLSSIKVAKLIKHHSHNCIVSNNLENLPTWLPFSGMFVIQTSLTFHPWLVPCWYIRYGISQGKKSGYSWFLRDILKWMWLWVKYFIRILVLEIQPVNIVEIVQQSKWDEIKAIQLLRIKWREEGKKGTGIKNDYFYQYVPAVLLSKM